MDRQQIFEKILDSIRPYVRNKAAFKTVTEQTRILHDLEVTSSRMVDIVLSLENKFGIQIDDQAADKVNTIGEAVEAVRERLKS